MAKPTKEQFAAMSLMELVGLSARDNSLVSEVAAEIQRRNDTAPPAQPAGIPIVDFNSGGGLMIQEGSKTTLSSTGSLYAGSANMPLTVARLLISDSPESVDVRKRAMVLLNLPADKIAARVAEKKAKKTDAQSTELTKTRKTIASAVKKGLMPQSALDEFDKQHPGAV